MIDEKVNLLKSVILEATRAEVEVHVDKSGSRRGLRAHFSGWTRQEGPVFSLTPSGLNRHKIELHFGDYALPCIKHIQGTANDEQYAVARAFVAQLAEDFEVSILPDNDIERWQIVPGSKVSVIITGIKDQHDDDEITRSVESGMVPLIAAVAELIGAEDSEVGDPGETEGASIEVVSIRRERSRRNRLLCLAAHGDQCGVCGENPREKFGCEVGQILEVHHIEPLSQLEGPKVYDPRSDLLPLCPNCHRAIHRRIPAFLPDELKTIIAKM